MSDFIASPLGRQFKKSHARDRVIRRKQWIVGREIVAYFPCFTSGHYPHRTFLNGGEFSSNPPKYWKRVECELTDQTIKQTQNHNIGYIKQEALTGSGIPEPDPPSGTRPIDLENLTLSSVTSIRPSGGQLNYGPGEYFVLKWEFYDELVVEDEYSKLAILLADLPFPEPVLVENGIDYGQGDTTAIYNAIGQLVTVGNHPNVPAQSEIAGYTLKKVKMFGAADFFVSWVGIRIRDVIVGSAGKIWEYTNRQERVDLGINNFVSGSLTPYAEIETSCEISIAPGPVTITAPSYASTPHSYGRTRPQIKVGFPGHKWSVPTSFPGEFQRLIGGLKPSCAPELIP